VVGFVASAPGLKRQAGCDQRRIGFMGAVFGDRGATTARAAAYPSWPLDANGAVERWWMKSNSDRDGKR